MITELDIAKFFIWSAGLEIKTFFSSTYYFVVVSLLILNIILLAYLILKNKRL